MEENRKEIVSDACIYNSLGIALAHTRRQTNGLTGARAYTLSITHLNTQGINIVLVGKL